MNVEHFEGIKMCLKFGQLKKSLNELYKLRKAVYCRSVLQSAQGIN